MGAAKQNDMLGSGQATTWPLAAVLAPSRWRALVRRRAPDVPATAAPSASGPAAEIESSATTSADETNLALAETSMASAEASDAIFFQASAAREAGIGSERDMPAADLPSGDAETHVDTEAHQTSMLSADVVVATPGPQLDTAAGPSVDNSPNQQDVRVAAEAAAIAAAEPGQVAAGRHGQAFRRRSSFRDRIKEAAAVPAFLRQVSLVILTG